MKYLTRNKHWDIVGDYNLDKLLYLLIDRPDYTNDYILWTWNRHNDINHFHRGYDLPAFIHFTANDKINIYWHLNGITYRGNNKPHVILKNGNL